MTADEMRRQKIDLTIQIEDAEKHLSSLREKARARADRIIQFGNWLKTTPELHVYRQGHSVHHDQPLDRIRMLSDADIEVLQLNPALEIANSIRKELANLTDLKERLARL